MDGTTSELVSTFSRVISWELGEKKQFFFSFTFFLGEFRSGLFNSLVYKFNTQHERLFSIFSGGNCTCIESEGMSLLYVVSLFRKRKNFLQSE